jgi:hypothetical protein
MKPASDTRKPYGGTTRSLVVALDVGTTFSGVSYAILEPGEVPKIHGVTRFPGQEHVAGNSKIPSVMYYDRHGKLKAAGAEAENASIMSQAEDEGWSKAELFKLRLRPKSMKLNMNGMRLGHLPHRKTATDVFGDILAYLFLCTRNFITDTHANGPALWHAVEHDIQFVLSHPNGWEGAQQAKMRRSAINGGLILDTDAGKARIRFVTEGEASLHACVLNGLAADVLSNPSRHGFLIADAGGGTLDISSYAIRGTSPLVIEEIAPPDCIFAGSVFVSRRAREFLEKKLQNSKYGTADSLDHITKRFDETTKRLFRDKKDLQFIPFGSPLDKDMPVGIRGGQLKLTGNEVSEFFEPSIEAAITSIKAQIDSSGGVVKSVWLVGGFAASPWLFNQLQERLAPLNVTVSRPDSQTSKAVADGAIGFYCDHHVSARMSKFMYGVEYLREFNHLDEEHVARRDRLCELPSGPKLLPDAFDCILARSKKVKESTVFSRKYCTELTSLSTLSVFEVEVWCYRGGDVVPPWILRQAEEFSTLCVVRADLSPLSGSAQAKQSKNGKSYWTIVFSIEIHFGLTEFKARIKWVDNGNTKYGPASIIFNESGHRADEAETESSLDEEVTVRSSRSDRFRSEPASGLRSRDSYAPVSTTSTASGKGGPAHRSPKTDITFREIPEVVRSPTTSKSSHTTDTGFSRERRYSGKEAEKDQDRERGRTNDKGKEREKTPSRNKVDHTKLADALTSVWGASAVPPSPLADSSSPKGLTASGRASARGGTPSRALREKELDLAEAPKTTNRSPVDVSLAAISATTNMPSTSPVAEAEVTKVIAADGERPGVETSQNQEEKAKEAKPDEVPDSGFALAGSLSLHSSPKKSSTDDPMPENVHPDPTPSVESEQVSTTLTEQSAAVSVAADPTPAVSVTSTPKPGTNTVTPRKKGKKALKNSVEPDSSPKPPPGPDVTLNDSLLLAKEPDADKVDTTGGTLLPTATDRPSSLFSEFLVPPVASGGEAPSPIEAGLLGTLGGVLTPKQASPLISEVQTPPASPKQVATPQPSSPNATASSLVKTSPAVVPDVPAVTAAEPVATTTSEVPVTKSESPKATEDFTAAPIIDAAEAPKADTPNIDAPKLDTPNADALKIDAPEIDTHKLMALSRSAHPRMQPQPPRHPWALLGLTRIQPKPPHPAKLPKLPLLKIRPTSTHLVIPPKSTHHGAPPRITHGRIRPTVTRLRLNHPRSTLLRIRLVVKARS